MLPVRNAAETLPECLDTIRAQSLTAFELLVVDDGSDDGSAGIVRRYAGDDARFHLLQPGRVGLVGALDIGIAHARAPLLARMDADDLMHPDRLRLQCEYLHRHPEIALVACQVELFPAERLRTGYREYVRWQNECIEPEQIAAELYVEAPFAHPSVMMRRSVVEWLGGYREGPFPEDYDIWLRMHHAGYRMAKLPRVLLRWRESAERTSRVDERYSRAAFDRLRAHYLARDPRLRQPREIVVWGAGRKTRQRVRPLLEQGIRPVAWIDIDRRKIGREIQQLPVHAPEWLQREPRPFVLVYVTNHGARDLIAARLSAWGYQPGRDYLAVG